MLGYIGGFVGPLAVGWVLDLQGSMSASAWAAAFAMIAAFSLAGAGAVRDHAAARSRRRSRRVVVSC